MYWFELGLYGYCPPTLLIRPVRIAYSDSASCVATEVALGRVVLLKAATAGSPVANPGPVPVLLPNWIPG